VRAVYAVDVGKTQRPANFAWVRVEPEDATKLVGSHDIRTLASRLKQDLKHGYDIALGFEAPLFIPVPEDADNLSRGRSGEGNRAWSAQAGSTVAMLGIHQAAWLLRVLRRSCGDSCELTLDRRKWPPTGPSPILFCWEAFVSGSAHGASHVQDAATAAVEFLRSEDTMMAVNAVTAEQPISLIGAVAVWSGWVESLDILHSPTLVIKPAEPYRGRICVAQ